ncbi:septal ring lytic transglycosylase RlpA family protein [Lewinella sp. IMCC34191]|uniref:septal ring lytic transglycosylase RlpA family protein n=1 Tax=Lewinella sp. IMCC34191 TaxID=2259172 RepID=UPI000E271484|nr:septal ring lytic transglycosylase RlpA family protein [Lewinella sp. IMCC34191]
MLTSSHLARILSLLILLAMVIPAGAQQTEGMASYYADRFHALPTSTGETYDKEAYTAASKEYPYNTRLEVTNVVSGQSVEVRVNDCGPHHPQRILDLSRAAADDIGLLRMGVAKVRLRVIELGTDGPTCERGAWARAEREKAEAGPPVAPTQVTAKAGSIPVEEVEETPEIFSEDAMLFGVQVGSYGKVANAEAMLERLRAAGFTDAWMAKVGKVNRVFTGKFFFQEEAKALRKRVRQAGFSDAAVRRVQ